MSADAIIAVLQSALRGFFKDLITRETTESLQNKRELECSSSSHQQKQETHVFFHWHLQIPIYAMKVVTL